MIIHLMIWWTFQVKRLDFVIFDIVKIIKFSKVDDIPLLTIYLGSGHLVLAGGVQENLVGNSKKMITPPLHMWKKSTPMTI